MYRRNHHSPEIGSQKSLSVTPSHRRTMSAKSGHKSSEENQRSGGKLKIVDLICYDCKMNNLGFLKESARN